MATPALKRRKLSHESDDDNVSVSSDGSKSAGLRVDQPTESTSIDHGRDTQNRRKPEKTQIKTIVSDDQEIYAGGVHKDNMFKMQVDEMLEGVRPSYKKLSSKVDGALRMLKQRIESIEDKPPLLVCMLHNLSISY